MVHGLRFTAFIRAADEAVADADDRLDAVAARAELLAQASYVNVECARVAVVFVAPDVVEKLLSRGDSSGSACERSEQGELFAREADGRAVAGCAHVVEVNREARVLVARGGGLVRAAHHCA